jgi:AraC-like DNA-binding protein
MKNADIEALNKISIPEGDFFGSSLRVLWVNAACDENKFTLNIKPHNHAFFEAHVIFSGSIVYRFNDRELTVSGGELTLIPPRVIHCIPYHSADFRKMTIAFETDGELAEMLSSKNKQSFAMTDDDKATLDFIIKRAKNKTACSELMIKNRLCELILSVAESATTGRAQATYPAYDTRIIKAKKYVEDNPHIFMTCDEVARYCNLSAKQLGRLFLQYEGVSLLAFIHGQKIEDAKKMITETDELLETISEKLGFSSVNYFGKFFTKHTGKTPGDFRRGVAD